MHHGDETHTTISRATSISRRTSVKAASALSRNSTLIKKNTAPNDLRPSDLLIERFVAWKAIVKQLIAYFEASLAAHTSTKTATDLLVGRC